MKGVVVYMEEVANEVRLVLDDVDTRARPKPDQWYRVVAFTANKYDARAFISQSLSKDQYAIIGENLVIRLLALNRKIS